MAVGYDELSQVMQIDFEDGDVYQFIEVPKEVYHDFLNHHSVDQYYYHYIKGKYRGEQINF